MTAIVAENLYKSFNEVHAVNGLSLAVQEGEIYGLLGPDGAGKTTTIRMMTGVLKPDRGSVSILGLEWQKNREEVKRHIGYLSQRFSLYGDLSVDENIDFFAEIHGVRAFVRRKNRLLDFTRLGPFRSRLAGRLSGGMKQKLALACTLVHSPELIVLDELDDRGRSCLATGLLGDPAIASRRRDDHCYEHAVP